MMTPQAEAAPACVRPAGKRDGHVAERGHERAGCDKRQGDAWECPKLAGTEYKWRAFEIMRFPCSSFQLVTRWRPTQHETREHLK